MDHSSPKNLRGTPQEKIRWRTFSAALLPFVLLAGCSGGGGVTEPAEPSIAEILVSSPIDTLIDLDSPVQLAVSAVDDQGQSISVGEVSWSSSNSSVATVSTSGLVRPESTGTVRVTAEILGVEGSLDLRIIQAEENRISTILADPFLDVLVQSLTSSLGTPLEDALVSAASELAAGDLVGALSGLEAAQSALATATDPTDRSLAAVIDLSLVRALSLFNL